MVVASKDELGLLMQLSWERCGWLYASCSPVMARFRIAAGASTSSLIPPTHATRTASPTTARVRSGWAALGLCGPCCISWALMPPTRASAAGRQRVQTNNAMCSPVKRTNLPAGVKNNHASYNDGYHICSL